MVIRLNRLVELPLIKLIDETWIYVCNLWDLFELLSRSSIEIV